MNGMRIVPVNAAAWRWWIRAKAYALFARAFPRLANAYQALSPNRHTRRRARVLATGYRFLAGKRFARWMAIEVDRLAFSALAGVRR